jgi:hypothetical protein
MRATIVLRPCCIFDASDSLCLVCPLVAYAISFAMLSLCSNRGPVLHFRDQARRLRAQPQLLRIFGRLPALRAHHADTGFCSFYVHFEPCDELDRLGHFSGQSHSEAQKERETSAARNWDARRTSFLKPHSLCSCSYLAFATILELLFDLQSGDSKRMPVTVCNVQCSVGWYHHQLGGRVQGHAISGQCTRGKKSEGSGRHTGQCVDSVSFNLTARLFGSCSCADLRHMQ